MFSRTKNAVVTAIVLFVFFAAATAQAAVSAPTANSTSSPSAAEASGAFGLQLRPVVGNSSSKRKLRSVRVKGRLVSRVLVRESASTTRWPWSGYWWPTMASTARNLFDNNESMHYYDYYVQKTRGYNPGAQTWEYNNHRSAIAWTGHCHAWSAASTLTTEPPSGGITRGGVYFPHDVLEGLITELHYTPSVSKWVGTRNDGTSTTTAAYKDINPADMDYMLRTYVRNAKKSFIMDIEEGSEVWNFPAFAYSRDGNVVGSVETVTTTVWYRDALLATWGSTNYNSAGQYTFRSKTYTYKITTLSTGAKTGTWTGNSVYDHPDFAWAAGGKSTAGRNPQVNEAIVEEILGYQI